MIAVSRRRSIALPLASGLMDAGRLPGHDCRIWVTLMRVSRWPTDASSARSTGARSATATMRSRSSCRREQRSQSTRRSGANGQVLAHVYLEEEPGRRSAAKRLTRDEVRPRRARVRSLSRSVGSQFGSDMAECSDARTCYRSLWPRFYNGLSFSGSYLWSGGQFARKMELR